METHLLTGERNISPQSHRGFAIPNRSGNGVSDKTVPIKHGAEYYTAVTLTIGVAACITIRVGKIVRGHDFSLKFTFLPPITVSTTRALPRDDVRLFLSLKEPEWLT
ncbi:MAG: hypothetical protein RSE65_19225 [Hafnia sp.]|uniref:hypothetical protein n=2 Tax=Hafnia TaxID=568 RepID=UPI001FFF497D|nr:hypothetical protein [Hafnia paralvei]